MDHTPLTSFFFFRFHKKDESEQCLTFSLFVFSQTVEKEIYEAAHNRPQAVSLYNGCPFLSQKSHMCYDNSAGDDTKLCMTSPLTLWWRTYITNSETFQIWNTPPNTPEKITRSKASIKHSYTHQKRKKMSLKNDTLPNEFWKHLGKFDLTDYAQPRWSILVNDNGLQVRE